MQTITYEMALRALNEAVRSKGPDYIDEHAAIGETCQNIVKVGGKWVPSCIVGTALVWLGVPVEWFVESRCWSASVEAVAMRLEEAGMLRISARALALFSNTQDLQDAGYSWGKAVSVAHLGEDWFYSLVER